MNNNNTTLQVWNNAAFDGDDFAMKSSSWSSSSDCIKENLSPTTLNKKPFQKIINKNKKTIDEEISEIETEINRLTMKLESLRLEKAERKIASEKRVSGIGTGRIIAAKFMEPKKNTPKRNGVVFKDETPKRNGVVFGEGTPKSRINWRRGMSLGPAEISGKVIPPAITPAKRNGVVFKDDTPKSRIRRGMSLGPAEISGKVMPPPPAITPATVNRRKSCFVKPQENLEEQRRKTICKANSVATMKCVKKKEEEIVQVEPRKLFESARKGRVVASRYNSGGDLRKRSFCENNKGFGNEIRVKKRWEIPIEEVDVSGFVLLPRISTLRCVDESPRDSGAAKRVAELNGKKSFFCDEESVIVEEDDDEGSVCQVLNFAEDDDDGQQG